MTASWLRRSGTPRLEFGADYNPEQWPRAVWDEDMRAMREAGVTIAETAAEIGKKMFEAMQRR